MNFFFENCVIAVQYYEYALRPEVSMTPGSGCFAMAQTDRQTYRRTWHSMTESAQRADLVKIYYNLYTHLRECIIKQIKYHLHTHHKGGLNPP